MGAAITDNGIEVEDIFPERIGTVPPGS